MVYILILVAVVGMQRVEYVYAPEGEVAVYPTQAECEREAERVKAEVDAELPDVPHALVCREADGV
jgi:hypothetical protein